jgi:hypothetical protein
MLARDAPGAGMMIPDEAMDVVHGGLVLPLKIAVALGVAA